MRVLITRPHEVAQSLYQKLKEMDAVPECFPTIEIIPTPNQKALNEAIEDLNANAVDFAIFSSQYAVMHSLKNITKENNINKNNFFNNNKRRVRFVAIGPSTKRALNAKGIEEVIMPLQMPYESETLLLHPELQQIRDRRIFIFQGNRGRGLLPTVLKERGAIVQCVEAYQRRLPILENGLPMEQWRKVPIDVIISTSQEGLNNFCLLLGKEVTLFQETPLIVVGLRMKALATNLGFSNVVMAEGAVDELILNVIKKAFENGKAIKN